MAKYKIKDPSVPPGVYLAEFDGMEETSHEQYGPGWLWKFIVAKGRYKGRTVARTTSPDPTVRNACGKFLAGLAGKSPEDEMEFDPEDFEGELYRVTVAETKNGGTRVDSFVRDKIDDDDDPVTVPEGDDAEAGGDVLF
jgi:hypothetical protein